MSSVPAEHSHDPNAISTRLDQLNEAPYIDDAVLGAIDGSVTTVAIVAGALGAQLSGLTVLILGVANLLADGVSMAVGNYQRARSDEKHHASVRRIEESHIDHHPQGEREEIRQIYARKGFQPPLLDDIVDTITQDRDRWVQTMLQEEWGLAMSSQSPVRVGIVTFVSFVAAGAIPLLPFLWQASGESPVGVGASAALAGATFVAIGVLRARIFGENVLLGGLGTLGTGGGAAFLAYAVAWGLATAYGI